MGVVELMDVFETDEIATTSENVGISVVCVSLPV